MPCPPPLARLVGTWTTEATHPAVPGVVVHSTVVIEWLEGQRFPAARYEVTWASRLWSRYCPTSQDSGLIRDVPDRVPDRS